MNIFLALELQVEFEEPGLKKSRILAAGLPGTFDCCQLPEATKFFLRPGKNSIMLSLDISENASKQSCSDNRWPGGKVIC